MTAESAHTRTFVDTNVLAYAHDLSESVKRPIAQQALSELWQSRSGVLSTQVLQEFYVVATKKFKPTMSRKAVRDVIGAYAAWPVVRIDEPMIIAASLLEERHSLSWWDALIIEAAKRVGARRLLSEDLQGGRRFGTLVVANPFAA